MKSKLKVAEQHVHILPMNTRVSVEGAQVTLLDANQYVNVVSRLLLQASVIFFFACARQNELSNL